MPKQLLTPTIKALLTLINNANDLIVVSNRRAEAKSVMKAMSLYAHSKNFSIPDEKVDNFMENLLDCRQNTLSYLLTDIAQTIVKSR